MQHDEEKTGHINQEADIEFFKQCETVSESASAKGNCPGPSQQTAYKEFLVGVAELTNSFLDCKCMFYPRGYKATYG